MENIKDAGYRLFPIRDISHLPSFIRSTPGLHGLNVTIPYKETVIPFLDDLDETAKAVGAVNCIKISRKSEAGSQKLVGYNTDVYGFKKSFKPMLKSYHEKALILGTGGGAKAVAYVLRQIGVEYSFVTRSQRSEVRSQRFFTYDDLKPEVIKHFKLIINTTPAGMFPNTGDCPEIPYQYITDQHLLYDLIYNPGETGFLKKGKEKGASVQNGLTMFRRQAEKAWEVWNG